MCYTLNGSWDGWSQTAEAITLLQLYLSSSITHPSTHLQHIIHIPYSADPSSMTMVLTVKVLTRCISSTCCYTVLSESGSHATSWWLHIYYSACSATWLSDLVAWLSVSHSLHAWLSQLHASMNILSHLHACTNIFNTSVAIVVMAVWVHATEIII